jgi:hypothetical protein
VVTLTGVETCSIAAHQAGNASYEPAPSVVRSFKIWSRVALPVVERSYGAQVVGAAHF